MSIGVRGLLARHRAASIRRWSARSARARRIRVGVAALGAVLMITAVVVLGVTALDRRAVSEARSEGLAAARTRTEQVLTFAPATAWADIERARESVAGPFADQFGALVGELIDPSLSRGASTSTTVTRAAVVDATPDAVVTLLLLQQTTTAPGGAPQVTPSQARVTVTDVAGQWLITDLQAR